ncbi:FAD/NAD-P-binding domain-containing protein [Mycena alexandri]|uniref:FAD/NAD-P-binding domain-containing protein n=1 Tax=Mycena alexandri TaxID=1745969 RepID=A0AAD6SJ44_9AGAR|nr:FAD/NAD-P-binding domain-containing protein [Mycena alexandri]
MSRLAVAAVLLATAILRRRVPASPWTTFPHPITRVAVIGAGPAGLQAAAHLLEANLTVRLFERAPSPGGNWFYTEETPVREEYPETNSKLLEDLPDKYPATRYYEEGDSGIALEERWRKHWQPRPVWYALRTNTPAPWRVSVHDVQRHIRAYASLHGLNSNDKPSSPPYSPVAVYSTRVEATYWTENFDAVVIATGLYTFPYVPSIKGIGNWSTAMENGQYSIYHSQSFRHAERYAGKTILLVGAWASATEIARTIGPFTNRLIASVRPNKARDGYGLNTLIKFPDKTEFVPEISSFEPLDATDIGIKRGKIVLSNDTIILATGYRPTNLGGPGTLDNLHWTAARTWTHGGYQSLAFAKVWTGKARLPSREQMWEDHQNQKYQFGTPPDIFPQEALVRQYVAFLNAESLELGGRFVEPLPVESVPH